MGSKFAEPFSRIVPSILAVTATGLFGTEKSSNREAFRDAVVHLDLEALYEDSLRNDPITLLGQDADILAVAAPPHESIFDRSDALNHGGSATLVPKGAVLYVPEHVKDRIGIDFDSQIVAWNDFYRKNSHWVMAFGVRLEQALGDEQIDQSLLLRLEKSGKVIVATYFEHPISVRETPAEGDEATDAEES